MVIKKKKTNSIKPIYKLKLINDLLKTPKKMIILI